MRLSKLLCAGLITAGLLGISAAPAAAQPPSSCFWISQWDGWSAPSPSVLYLRVNRRDIYRVDLSGPSSILQSPGVHLVSRVIDSSSICSAIDLDLSVSDGHGIREPLIARSITRLTPEEVASVPAKFRP
jgi:hypothetical protein